MSKNIHIKELHHLHADWNSMLDLTKDEILSFEIRLQEITKANTGKEVMAQVEHFQNQFTRQKEVIDQLLQDIHEDELRITENVKENNVAVEHRTVEENFRLKDSLYVFQKIFKELKSEYLLFLAKIM
ncbi:MAG: hypothetical protein ACK5FT_07870 [Sphingomonadales bacterium]|jgi:hypothetical protein